MFKYKNLEKYNFNIHKEYLEQLLLSNIDLKQKKILVIIIKNPWQQFINFPVNSNGIRYIQIDLDKSDFFLIDDHPNSLGHKKISNVLKDSIYKMNK